MNSTEIETLWREKRKSMKENPDNWEILVIKVQKIQNCKPLLTPNSRNKREIELKNLVFNRSTNYMAHEFWIKGFVYTV